MKTYALADNVAVDSANNIIASALQVIGGAFILGLCAHIKVPLFFTPVPLSLQTLGFMLIGGLLGTSKGSLSACLYVVLGCLGMPFFVGASTGFAYLLGPTGGYILGFIIQTYLTGQLASRVKSRDPGSTYLLLSLICLLQLSLGSLWLSLFVGWNNAWVMGFTPFILGEMLKSLIATATLRSGWQLLPR